MEMFNLFTSTTINGLWKCTSTTIYGLMEMFNLFTSTTIYGCIQLNSPL